MRMVRNEGWFSIYFSLSHCALRAGMSPYASLAVLLLAAALSSCGGGSSSSSGAAPASNEAIAVADLQTVRLPDGGALAAMADALVVGDHLVVRSRSDSFIIVNGYQVHPRTRLSVLDAQGKLTASTDYGFTLAAGYTGEWLMLPSPDGFLMVQAGAGARMLHFDPQAKLSGGATDLYPAVATTSTTELAAAENGAAVDGNGFWLATTFSLLPVTDKTQYQLKLCKFDFNGNQSTPPFVISTSALHPRVAAASGVVLAGWMENGGATLAMWPKATGAPSIRSLSTGGAQPYPVALDVAGKMGVLWNGKGSLTTPGGVMGVTIDADGAAVLPAGRTDLTQETLSATWQGNVRTTDIDAHAFSGGLALASSVIGAFNPGDTPADVLVLADYGVGTGTLSAQAATVLRFKPADALGLTPVFRQMQFSDHALLLMGDDSQLRTLRVTRKR
jgi:hypothetical protein